MFCQDATAFTRLFRAQVGALSALSRMF